MPKYEAVKDHYSTTAFPESLFKQLPVSILNPLRLIAVNSN